MSEGARKPKRAPGVREGARPASTPKRIGLPQEGDLLSEDGLAVQGAAAGLLAGNERGALCYLHYTYRSDDTTHEVNRTAAVLRVPESIGFAPYLGSGRIGQPTATRCKAVELDGGGARRRRRRHQRRAGSPSSSPRRSPSGSQRNPDDFEWELRDGVLCASREGHIRDAGRSSPPSATTPPTSRRRCARSASRRSSSARRSGPRRSRRAHHVEEQARRRDARQDDLR